MNATADLINKPGVLDTFFTVLGVLVTGLAAGFTVVGVFVYNPPKEEEEEDLYEDKYSEEFEELEEKELTDDFVKGLSSVYLTEETPEGQVVMCYDKDTECYNYWCDDKNVYFLNLDAVAQKYAIDNDCKALCVNYKLEVEKAEQELKEKKEKKREEVEEIEEEKDEKPSVFAKFKSYNTVNKKEASDDKEGNSVQVEKSNTFKYKGKIYEWENQSKACEDKKSSKNDSLSLSEWLKKKKEDQEDETKEDSSSEENVELKTNDKVESKKEK